MPRTSVVVNSRIVRWAREAAGLTLPLAAKRASIPLAKLEAWERSERAAPTPRQLEQLADVFKRPVALFFLSEPPSQPEQPNDFRRFPQGQRRSLGPEALVAVRVARRLQSLYSEFKEFAEEQSRVLQTSPEVRTHAESLAQAVRASLSVSLDDQFGFQDDESAFRRWREEIEALGFLVAQFERVEPEEVRGFSLLGDPAVIAINLHDRPVTAKTFTLFHEVAHVIRGQAALCIPEAARLADTDDAEVFCNAFAAELLVPARAFLSSPPVERFRKEGQEHDVTETVAEARQLFRVGRFVILRRLLTLDLISASTYRKVASVWQREGPPVAAPGGGGPGAYQRKILNELGRPLVKRIFRAQEVGAVSVGEVVEMLAVKRRHLDTLRDLAFR